MDVSQIIPLMSGGLVITGILLFLSKKLNPFVQMYLTVALMSGIQIACMIAFPCTTNYIMFFLGIFFVVIYEDIRPIVLQCSVSAVCMIYFYYRYTQELIDTWSPDAMAMCVVYIVSGMLIFISLCRLTKQQLDQLEEVGAHNKRARRRAEKLLGDIGNTVNVLDNTSNKINENITVTEQIANQIAESAENVAKRTEQEVADIEEIQSMVADGVSQIKEVSDTSANMTQISNATSGRVQEGGQRVENLTGQMEELNGRMDDVVTAITRLTQENAKIVDILTTLDGITSQTNLLSLNASIEAARAGEHGKGFAVVATEIRNLSENSSQFTEQIHEILNGIQEQTKMVQQEIVSGQDSVRECTQQAIEVNRSFQDIADNTSNILTQAQEIDYKSTVLETLMNNTLSNVNAINENVESTSVAMEEISSSIFTLHGKIDNVVGGYNDINQLTTTLVEAADTEQK